MLGWTTRVTVIVCMMCIAIASSQASSEAASAVVSQSPEAFAAIRGDTTAAASVDCTKVYSQADAAGLLKAPVTLRPFPGGIAWCNFGNDFSGDITVTVGSNESAEMMWNDAAATANRSKFVPLTGVGDEALFEAGTEALNPELASKKGSVYCIVTYDRGTSDHYKKFNGIGGAELGKRLGTLCNKAFAAVRT